MMAVRYAKRAALAPVRPEASWRNRKPQIAQGNDFNVFAVG
ncbi:MAG: hypothetical protein ACREFN_15425 [Acetobacteraceae bacterium]